MNSDTMPFPADAPGGRLRGRVAIVTGGSGGIGAAIADDLADAAAAVVNADLSPGGSAAGAHHFEQLDIVDEPAIENMVARVIEEFGRLDIVVNNAGIMFERPLGHQDLQSWNRMMAVNLTGPMLLSRAAAPHLAANGVGSIINVSSLEGHCCNPGHAAYASSKAGVQGLTRATAVDLGPAGVRCNAVAPGWIDTPLNAAYVDDQPDPAMVREALSELHPVGRIGCPRDVANVVTWLASDEARFVTGQVITVDGGRTARPPLPSMVKPDRHI